MNPVSIGFHRVDSTPTESVPLAGYGNTHLRKADNMRLLAEKHHLEHPVYVGDTEGDCNETHHAGLPFVWMSYGFGTTENYELRCDTFGQLVEYFEQLATRRNEA